MVSIKNISAVFIAWIVAVLPCFLVLSTVFLYSTKTLFNIPMGIMAVLGLYQLILSPRKILTHRGVKFTLIAFLCLWIPMLIALIGATNLSRSSETVIPYLHFLFAAIFIVIAQQSAETRYKIQIGVTIIIFFWCIDALIQFFTGFDLFGYPYNPPQLSGMFYPKIRLGHVVAVFSPIIFEYIRQRCGEKPWLILMIIPVFAVVLLSGKRVAWLMLFIAVILYFIYLWKTTRKINHKLIIISMILGVSTAVLLYTYHQPFQNRINQSLGVFSSSYEQADTATARRLDLWKTSITIFKENWINGIGPRGFRNAYSNYADKDNFWMKNGREGQTHPHQFLMEIATETGIIGVMGYLIFWLVLFTTIWREYKTGNISFITWSLCVIVSMFPFNAHLAFYGSYWSSVMWLIFAMTAGWLSPIRDNHGN